MRPFSFAAGVPAVLLAACAVQSGENTESTASRIEYDLRESTIAFCDWDHHPTGTTCHKRILAIPYGPNIPNDVPCDLDAVTHRPIIVPGDGVVFFAIESDPAAHPAAFDYGSGTETTPGTATCALLPTGKFSLMGGTDFWAAPKQAIVHVQSFYDYIAAADVIANVDYEIMGGGHARSRRVSRPGPRHFRADAPRPS